MLLFCVGEIGKYLCFGSPTRFSWTLPPYRLSFSLRSTHAAFWVYKLSGDPRVRANSHRKFSTGDGKKVIQRFLLLRWKDDFPVDILLERVVEVGRDS